MSSSKGIEVVDLALLAFWRLGYEGCSISHLVEATGVQRQSLYNAYGDKQGLFLAALKRYEALLGESLAPLRCRQAGLSELQHYMEEVLTGQTRRGVGGCLLVKTAFGPDIDDARIRRVVEQGADTIRSCFANVIRQTIASGGLTGEVDPVAGADYLYAVLNGLSALSRTGATPKRSSAVLTHALGSLGQPRRSRLRR